MRKKTLTEDQAADVEYFVDCNCGPAFLDRRDPRICDNIACLPIEEYDDKSAAVILAARLVIIAAGPLNEAITGFRTPTA